MLRFFGLMDIAEQEWDEMFGDIESVILSTKKE